MLGLKGEGRVTTSVDVPGYRTIPIHTLPWLSIHTGHDYLASELKRLLRETGGPARIVIDGFSGVQWGTFIGCLRAELIRRGVSARWISTEHCLLPPERVDDLLAPFLTSDPVFGRLFHGHLDDLWDTDHVAALKADVASLAETTIIYGCGAALIESGGIQVYLDVPKDRGQALAAQGTVVNLGARAPEGFSAMYKRLYFVEWPMLSRIKRAVLPRLDVFVDVTDVDAPVCVDGISFRRALHAIGQRPFRLKPWFAPGPWGGQWMKDRFGLPPDQPNYAWSFELIAPENGLVLGNGTQSVEFSFDYLLWQETEAVLGEAVAARYGSYFPIRFDYLDTMGGTNLSCQVHPRLDYIRDEFGEPITQDETYYVVTCQPDAQVFLGLRDDIDIACFKADATAARDHALPFDIATYVNCLPSSPHSLFLIPSGTVHCSGANNLVLEISATPYIYTFKIYDYLRKDLSSNLRHVHLERAFQNVEPTRTATWVGDNLVPSPRPVRVGETWAEYCIGDIARLFFAIHRLEFQDTIEDDTQGKFLALNLVDGERCEIVTDESASVELRFAESIVIPATTGHYRLRNMGHTPCKVVKAFVK